MVSEAKGQEKIVGVIGGTGVYNFMDETEQLIIETPFGLSPALNIGYIGDTKVVFLPRHSRSGEDKLEHAIPPHMINYKANVYALHKLNISRIIATHSCGSMRKALTPGSFILPSQFIDQTKRRDPSFFDGSDLIRSELKLKQDVVHVDVTYPFCQELTEIIFRSCTIHGAKTFKNCTYVCTEGPRFETPAEIRAFSNMGGDVVGMTLVPEVVLSRELGMCYSSISLVSNYAAGISEEKVSFREVVEEFEKNKTLLFSILKDVVGKIPSERKCSCNSRT